MRFTSYLAQAVVEGGQCIVQFDFAVLKILHHISPTC